MGVRALVPDQLVDTLPAALQEMRATSSANGGTSLSTTAAFIELLKGSDWLSVVPRNFATAVVAQIALNPYVMALRTRDDLATAIDHSEDAQDADTSTSVVLGGQDTAANKNYLYVGAHLPFRGLRAVVGSANAIASVMTVSYWNGTAWTNITATDGTASAGASVGQTGNITWTVPAAWGRSDLGAIGAATAAQLPGATVPWQTETLYWVRITFSVALSATVTLTSLLAMNRATAYPEFVNGAVLEARITRGPGGIGCVEAKVDAGTGNLIVNCGCRAGTTGLGL